MWDAFCVFSEDCVSLQCLFYDENDNEDYHPDGQLGLGLRLRLIFHF